MTRIPFVMVFICCSLYAGGKMDASNKTALGNEHYRIFSNTEKSIVSINDVADAFCDYDVLIFGEEHNDSVGHYLEYLLLEELFVRYGSALALSLEMFDRDVQVVLNEYLENKIETRYFEKDARIWMNYEDYRPMVEYAKENAISIIAANAPFRYVHITNSHGQQFLQTLSEEAKRFIAPLPYDTIEGVYRKKLIDLMAHIPEKRMEETESGADEEMKEMPRMPNLNIIQGQSLWNATMAYSITDYLSAHPETKVMHVNGRMHSDEYFGVPEQLEVYRHGVRTLIISAFPDSAFPETDFSRYERLADFVIITDPEVPKTFEQ